VNKTRYWGWKRGSAYSCDSYIQQLAIYSLPCRLAKSSTLRIS